jgi:dTDP-4-dehydrorhamnose reductase
MASIISAKKPSIAVFGAGGFIGGALYNSFMKNGVSCDGYDIIQLKGLHFFNIEKPDIDTKEFIKRNHTHAIIASAITGIAECERNPQKTHSINVTGTLELARQLSAKGVRVCVFSSDYVFDGIDGNYSEDSKKNPLNEYGRQKATIEDKIKEGCNQNFCVMRLSKVFKIQKGGKTLLDEIAGKLMKGDKLRIARDQVFCPICIDDLIEIVRFLVLSNAEGLINVCSPEPITRLSIVKKIANAFSLGLENVQEISLDDIDDTIKRPKNTTMTCDRQSEYYLHRFNSMDDWICKLKKEYFR